MRNNQKGLTLIELTVVMIIVSILVAVATPAYFKSRESAKDKEAHSALQLIRSAERAYFLTNDKTYYSSNNIDLINQNLNLELDDSNWAFWVGNSTSGTKCSPDPKYGTAVARSDGRIWEICRNGTIICFWGSCS